MNTQDILQKGRSKFDIVIDKSETYDFELVPKSPNMVIKEYYRESVTYRILTESGGILKTEDNFRLRY
jgi:hypothetical protein